MSVKDTNESRDTNLSEEEEQCQIYSSNYLRSVYNPEVKRINNLRGAKTFVAIIILTTTLGQNSVFINIYSSIKKLYKIEENSSSLLFFWSAGRVIGTPLTTFMLLKFNTSKTYSYFVMIFSFINFINVFNTKNFTLLCLTYGFFGGVFSGSTMVIPIYIVWRYLKPERKPYIAGMYLFLEFIIGKYALMLGIGQRFIDSQKLGEAV